MNVLVLNAGSSTLKAKLLDTEKPEPLLSMTVERIGSEGVTHESAVATVLASAASHRVDAVGHRVVHGGERLSLIHISEPTRPY